MIEAWIDGVSWSSLGIGIIKRDITPLPDTRDYSVKIAGLDGEVDFGSEYGPRIVPHECILMADDPTTDYQAKARQIARAFDAKRGERIVTYSDLPGKRYRMRYAGTLLLEKIIFDGKFTLPMKMFDPFPESTVEQILETTITISPYSMIAQSDGDINASPIFVLTNIGSETLASFKIQNEYQIE
jgi:phage-related protein